jgi:opacity protein-like surface antigen
MGLATVIGSTLPAKATSCSGGGFYVTASVGAAFRNATMKVDTKKGTEYITKAGAPIMGKITDAQGGLKKAGDACVPFVNDLSAKLATIINQLGLQAARPAALALAYPDTTKGGLAGSLIAIAEGGPLVVGADQANNGVAPMRYILAALITADPNLKNNDKFKIAVPAASLGITGEELSVAVANLMGQGQLGVLVAQLGAGAGILAKELFPASSLGQNAAAHATHVFDTTCLVADYEKAPLAAQTAYVTAANEAKALLAVMRSGLTSQTEGPLVDVFFKKDGDKLVPNEEISEVQTKLQALGTAAVAKSVAALGLDTNGKASKKATGFGFDLGVGYDAYLDGGLILGASVHAVAPFGGTAKVKGKSADASVTGVTVKSQFGGGVLLQVGYNVTSQLTPYLCGGLEITRYKVDTSALTQMFPSVAEMGAIAEKINAVIADASKKIDMAPYKASAEASKFKSHSATKARAVFGGGLQFAITPMLSAFVQCVFLPNTVIVKADKAGAEVKMSEMRVSAGVKVYLG